MMGFDKTPPRRYRTHGEALKGSFTWPFRLAGRNLVTLLVSGVLCAVLPNFFREDPLDWTTVLFIPVCLLLTAWLIGGVLFYLAVALAGGIMSREERRRR